MQKKWLLPVVMGLAFSLLVPGLMGCDGIPATDTHKNGSPVDTLDGSQWKLISIDGNQLVSGSYISLCFCNGIVRGFAGISIYGAHYSLQAPATLIFSDCYLAGTDGSKDIQRQENAYFKDLNGLTSYHFENDHLMIVNTAHPRSLVFERLPEYHDPSALVGTKWRLISLNDEPVLEGLSITLGFDSNVQASGQAGPFAYELHFKYGNEYVYVYGWGDLRIIGGADNLTLQNLSPAESQALHYIDGMEVAANYRLTGDKLEIFTARGDTLTYKPLTDSTK